MCSSDLLLAEAIKAAHAANMEAQKSGDPKAMMDGRQNLQNAVRALTESASVTSAELSNQKNIWADLLSNPEIAGIIMLNGLQNITDKNMVKKGEQVAPGAATEIPKLNEAGTEAQATVENNIQNALDEIEEFRDEKLAESMMDDETKSLWQKAKSWISELGELARYLVSKGETGFKASKTSANAIRPEIQAMTVEQAKARFREVQSKLKTALKKMLGKESTPRTKKSGPQEKRDTAIRKDRKSTRLNSSH